MPLFAYWRRTKQEKEARRGEEGEAVTTITITTNHNNNNDAVIIFCAFHSGIETTLRRLHAKQRVHGTAQPEIDAYLVACISREMQDLVLPRQNVPHYNNLPDMSSYALGILDPTMDTDPELQQVLLLLRQCMPLRRRTKRAQREVQWRASSLGVMQTLVRCVQGTLLGLYPNCLKATAFGARVGLLRFLRTLLVQPFERLNACMQRIAYIVKLGVMEHLCNTIYDYHPGICHILNRSGQKIEHFCNSVSTICDIFRGELNTIFCASSAGADATDVILDTLLPRLEHIARSYFERCTRAYRGIIVGHTPSIRSIDTLRRLLRTCPPSSAAIAHILDTAHDACSQGVFDAIHSQHLLPADLRELAWHLTQSIQVRTLPRCVMERQRAALQRRYGDDTVCMQRCRRLYVCLLCIVRRGNVFGTRLRHDCRTGRLACIHCGPDAVLAIDMLGRIVTIVNDRLLLSACCATVIYYTGSGYEWNGECGAQCASGRQLFRKRETPIRGTNRAAITMHTCFVCNQRLSGTAQTLSLLDIRARQMCVKAFCVRHAIPKHAATHILDERGLAQFCRQRTQSRL